MGSLGSVGEPAGNHRLYPEEYAVGGVPFHRIAAIGLGPGGAQNGSQRDAPKAIGLHPAVLNVHGFWPSLGLRLWQFFISKSG